MNEQKRPLENSAAYDSTYSFRRSKRISRKRVTARMAGLFMIFAFAFYTWLALNQAAYMAYPHFEPTEPIVTNSIVPMQMTHCEEPLTGAISGEDNTVYFHRAYDFEDGTFSNVPGQPTFLEWTTRSDRPTDSIDYKFNGGQVEFTTRAYSTDAHDDPEPVPPSDSNSSR